MQIKTTQAEACATRCPQNSREQSGLGIAFIFWIVWGLRSSRRGGRWSAGGCVVGPANDDADRLRYLVYRYGFVRPGIRREPEALAHLLAVGFKDRKRQHGGCDIAR